MNGTPGIAPPQLRWLAAIRAPHDAVGWSLAEWEQVVRTARRLRLLARLAESLDSAGLLAEVPDPPRRHLVSEQRVSRYRTAAMVWALDRIMATLGPPDHPCVLLKGAAYLGQGLPIAAGRLPSDVDVLVPLHRLAAAQARLVADGWAEPPLDAHDQRYYREWSHEVPPMRHPVHAIELDLHHNILPPVARTRVDAGLLLAHVRPSQWPGWSVLQPVDQVLHSAAHLFLDAEPLERVRDLVDLDGLLRHFGEQPGFWDLLPRRARELGLGEPLALAGRFCIAWLGTPIPAGTQAALAAFAPSAMRRAWLLPAMTAILTPSPPDAPAPWTQGAAATLLLARYHWNRMPLSLLVPHLWHKSTARPAVKTSPTDPGQPGR